MTLDQQLSSCSVRANCPCASAIHHTNEKGAESTKAALNSLQSLWHCDSWYAKPRALCVWEKACQEITVLWAGLFTPIHMALSKCSQEAWTRRNCWRVGLCGWEPTFSVVVNALLWKWKAEVCPKSRTVKCL